MLENCKAESTELEKMYFDLSNLYRQYGELSTSMAIAFCYSAFITTENNYSTIDEIEKYVEQNVSDNEALFIKENISEKMNLVKQIAEKYTDEQLLSFVLFISAGMDYRSGNETTPDSIVKLVLRLMEIKDGQFVADFGCGRGNFLVKASSKVDAEFFGNDINTTSKSIAAIRAKLTGKNIQIVQEDMFKSSSKQQFDKIFSNYPFGMRIRDLAGGMGYLETLQDKIPNIVKATSSDWIFNSLLLTKLKHDGKAIAIMTNGSTWNNIDKPIREYFVNNGLIECIISLPAKLFETTLISTTLIVLSNGNKNIKMIDAHEIFEVGRRQNTLSEANIDKIVSCLEKDSEISKTVLLNEVAENDYVINPIRYLSEEIVIENGVEFGSVIKSITRGAQCKASELDDLNSEKPTSMKYLMLSNIQDGLIDTELPYLSDLPDKYKKYCIKDKSLLISKNGMPVKVAVAEVDEKTEILGNGNLYIVEIDEEKANPYFVKAFLDSEQGIASLKQIIVGTTIPNIPVEALKKMIIPAPTLQQQNEIANNYLAKLDEIKLLNLRIAKAKNQLKGIYEEVDK